jgi:hypothetical protein
MRYPVYFEQIVLVLLLPLHLHLDEVDFICHLFFFRLELDGLFGGVIDFLIPLHESCEGVITSHVFFEPNCFCFKFLYDLLERFSSVPVQLLQGLEFLRRLLLQLFEHKFLNG